MGNKQTRNDGLTDLEEFAIPSYEEWEKVAVSSLKGKPIDKLYTSTYEGITLKPIYTKADEQLQQIKMSASSNTWEISQELHASNIHELIFSIQQAISYGQTSLNIQLKTIASERGVKINHLEELAQVLTSVPLEKLTFFVNTRLQQTAFIAGVASFQKKNNTDIKGVIGSDPIAEWVSNGQLPTTLAFYYDEMAAVLKETQTSSPNLKTILVQSHPYHNGGANAVQELACCLSVAIEYVRQCLDRGFTIDEVAPQVAFSFSIGSNLFMEIAKLRAAKYLWASIINEFGGNSESQKMWLQARTSKTTKTKNDPYVNMLRSTVESFAVVIGGAKSIHTSTFDEAFQTATPFSERIARNVQSILKEEAHLSRVLDPSNGSWYIESLTKQIAEKAWESIQKIERNGGITNALREGSIQEEIKKTREARFEKIDRRKERIIGVNMYANVNEEDMKTSQATETISDEVAMAKPTNLKLSCSEPNFFNLIESELQKGMSFKTIQESVQIEDHEQAIEVIPAIRWSMKIEMLRENANQYYEKTGEKLAVKLINLGEVTQHKPRTDFIKGLFEIGGFHVNETTSFLSIEDVEKGLAGMNERVIVICGHDETYSKVGRNVVELVKNSLHASHLFIAGKLDSHSLPEYVSVGLTDCIHVDTNCYQFLLKLQRDLEGSYEKA
jgi:methylmalonyl-CoA mutase